MCVCCRAGRVVLGVCLGIFYVGRSIGVGICLSGVGLKCVSCSV